MDPSLGQLAGKQPRDFSDHLRRRQHRHAGRARERVLMLRIPVSAFQRRRGRLGWPILPDTFNTASGASESFSPNTPDQQVFEILQQQDQALPAALAAKWATVTASAAPVSTHTGARPTAANVQNIAPGRIV